MLSFFGTLQSWYEYQCPINDCNSWQLKNAVFAGLYHGSWYLRKLLIWIFFIVEMYVCHCPPKSMNIIILLNWIKSCLILAFFASLSFNYFVLVFTLQYSLQNYAVDEDSEGLPRLKFDIPKDIAQGFINNKKDSYAFRWKLKSLSALHCLLTLFALHYQLYIENGLNSIQNLISLCNHSLCLFRFFQHVCKMKG